MQATVAIEKRGKPAVGIVCGRFAQAVTHVARSCGMPDARFVAVPLLYRGISQQRAIEQSDAVFEDLVRELTTTQRASSAVSVGLKSAGVERFEGEDALDALNKMDWEFLDKDWGDGYPLKPATPAVVEKLLKGVDLARDYVPCDLPPSDGVATVEKIAINAAMAGALPEHMPVIIAALKALTNVPRREAESLLMSTSAKGSLLLVNGPIAKELGINSGMCLGPGRQNRVNIAIGRAYTLCLKNIGHWYPGVTDMDTIGSQRKFTPCIAENEDTSPWEPFHVEKGFKKEDSVVTLMGTVGEIDMIEGGHPTPEGALKAVAYNATFAQTDMCTYTHHLGHEDFWETIVLCPPDLLRTVAGGGFSKHAAKQFIHHHAKMGIGRLSHHHLLREANVAPEWRFLLGLTEKERDEIVVNVRESADRYQLLSVGLDRSKPMIIPCHNPPRPVSVNLDEFRPMR